MHRRNFLARCGLAVAGSLFLPVLSPGLLQAADSPTRTSVPSTAANDELIRYLSIYSSNVHAWGAKAFTENTGLEADAGTVHLLARVDDLRHLGQFFSSPQFNKFGPVHVIDNTLNFTFRGTDYTVTNALPKDFTRLAGAGK